MPKPLDPKVGEILKTHGFGPDACWDCHGTWVVYHKVLEQIAASTGIVFEQPFIVEANTKDKIAALCVTGNLGERSEWSIGEAAPGNNKNAYPWAMAEKRGKDRVILKLIGLHGLVYSEDEADEFKESVRGTPPAHEPHARKDGDGVAVTKVRQSDRDIRSDLAACEDADQFGAFLQSKETQAQLLDCARHITDWWDGDGDLVGLRTLIEQRAKELGGDELEDRTKTYLANIETRVTEKAA